MNDDEILEELANFPIYQQRLTRIIWERAESMRVCWICGDEEAEVRQLILARGYICRDCYSNEPGTQSGWIKPSQGFRGGSLTAG